MARIVRGAETVPIETPGGNAGSALATPGTGAAEVSVIRQRQQPGGANPAHTHDREEVMVVLAGSVTVTVEAAAHRLDAGDALVVPAHEPHRVENAGTGVAEWLLVAPAGVRFFHANGDEATPPWAR